MADSPIDGRWRRSGQSSRVTASAMVSGRSRLSSIVSGTALPAPSSVTTMRLRLSGDGTETEATPWASKTFAMRVREIAAIGALMSADVPRGRLFASKASQSAGSCDALSVFWSTRSAGGANTSTLRTGSSARSTTTRRSLPEGALGAGRYERKRRWGRVWRCDRRFVPLALGGALFLLSDLILAGDMFSGLYFPLIGDVIWLTYGPAQMLIVYSIGAAWEKAV